MRSNRPPQDVDRLRDEVRDLARENAELRALIQRQLGSGGAVEGRELPLAGDGADPALPPRELERRRRIVRRVTFNLVLLAVGVAVAIFSALRIYVWPVTDRNDSPAGAAAPAVAAPRAPAVPEIPPPPAPAPTPVPAPSTGPAQ